MISQHRIGLFLGPALFFLIYGLIPNSFMPRAACQVLAITAWISAWWVSEALPIPVTSLLPLSLFPLMGVMNIAEAAQPYISPIIFLFIGGFILALALEKWNLHRRIALNIISLVGTKGSQLVLGFMLATGFLSMWISNTATTMMMVPIAMAIIFQLLELQSDPKEQSRVRRMGKALILCIPYAATIGGLATLVGTPTTLIFAGFVEKTYGVDVDFGSWLKIGLPVSLVLLPFAWWVLVKVAFRMQPVSIQGGRAAIDQELSTLGSMKREELWVLVVFGLVAVAWMLRSVLLKPWLPGIHDSIIALIGATLLFVIPSQEKGKPLMDWETAQRLPWGILLLFGGAFSVAKAFEVSGLVSWMAEQFDQLAFVGLLGLLFIMVGLINFLTEIVQNMATITLMLPVLAALAPALEVHPYFLMVPICFASSCAFMLPFATAPNAIAFGSNYLEMKDMIRAGFWINVGSILLISLLGYFFLPNVWTFPPLP
ncbi:MAG: SLC13 family permease [Bacteroidota bacterium]